MMESNKTDVERRKGWSFPPEIVELYEERVLNAEEVMLLGKIRALQKRETRACTASNAWLSRWWGKSENWVSRTISKFQGLKILLVRTKQTPFGAKRKMRVNFDEPLLQKSKSALLQKSKTGCYKSQRALLVPSNRRTARQSNTPGPTSGNTTFGAKGLLPVMPITKQESDIAKLVDRYVTFSIKKRWHVGRKGSTKQGWGSGTISSWRRRAKELIEQASLVEVTHYLNWFLHHSEDDFVPVCQTFSKFCEKFNDVKAAAKRSTRTSLPTETRPKYTLHHSRTPGAEPPVEE